MKVIKVTYLKQVSAFSPINRAVATSVQLYDTPPKGLGLRCSRGGIRGPHEASEMEICVEIFWDHSLSRGCYGRMDLFKQGGLLEDFSTLQRGSVYLCAQDICETLGSKPYLCTPR
jgi:hypothetical protein